MKKDQILHTLKELRKDSKKRKFSQTVDLVINFKELDKKHNVDVYVHAPHDTGKGITICAVLDHDMVKKAEGKVDKIISKEELGNISEKEAGKVAKEYDVFISEASLMGLLATKMGRILGPLGKMPNPRAGGVVMPGGNIEDNVSRFKSNLRIRNNKESIVKISGGKEDFKDEDLADNVFAIYEAVHHALPHGERNVKDVILKFTMSKPFRVGQKIKGEENA